MDELAEVTNRQRAMWGAGNYVPFGQMLLPSSARLVEAAGIVAGERVVDVGCGTGNTSFAAARAGAQVTGVDLTPNMLRQARVRAADEGFRVEFLEGDAQALPLPDDAFDVALSTFGCMFAPDHARTAAELARVVRPGGRIAFTGWSPVDGPGAFLRLVATYLPPPPESAGNPLSWGDEAYVRELFARAAPGAEVTTSTDRITVVFDSVDDAVDTYTTEFGPIVLARESLKSAGNWGPLVDALRGFFSGMPSAQSGGILMDSDYLRTVVRLPA